MESNDSPEIPDRGETSNIPSFPSGVTETKKEIWQIRWHHTGKKNAESIYNVKKCILSSFRANLHKLHNYEHFLFGKSDGTTKILKKKVVFGSYLQTARAIDMKSGKQHVKWSQITAFEVMAIVSAVCLAVLYQSMLGCCVVTHVFCLNHIQSLTLN